MIDGQISIDAVNGLLHGGGDGAQVSGIANIQIVNIPRRLCVGEVIQCNGGFSEVLKLRIFRNSDYFNVVGMFLVSESVMTSDGRALGKQSTGHIFGDDGNLGRRGCVLRSEAASGN